MKLKSLIALAIALLFSASGWAQTDVTSTYLTNADFSQTTALTGTYLYGYGKDGSPYGFQAVDGWTFVVTSADNSNAKYPNSGMAAGVFSYGSSTQLKGNAKAAPATNPNGEASGKCFGFFGVWGCGGYYYQTVTLAAGAYTINVPMYNQSGTQANTTYTGFFPTSGTNRTVAVNPAVGSWKTQTVSFTLTEATEGQIRIGYQSTGNGSGANPHIFVDCVKIIWTDPNLAAAQVKLGGYIKKATALNGVLSDATLGTAITAAQGVLDEATTSAACNDASDDLSAAITTALSGATPVSLTNGNFDTTPNNTLSGNETVFGGTLSTATSNPDNTMDLSTANTGDHGYLYDVTGWTQYSKFNSTASQGTTSEYGTAMPANGWSTNSTTPPEGDMFGEVSGAALHLSAGWGDQARYQQTIDDLPSGRYVFYYEVINQYSNTGIASNYIGVNGTSGDFYGTTNSFVYSGLSTIEQGVWKAQAFEFDVAKTANINFNVGVTTSTSGSGNGAKLWIDNVLVYRIADIIVTEEEANAIIASAEALDEVVFNATDKSALASALSTFKAAKNIDNYNALNAALIQANASKDVYTTLNAAITKVEGWTATTAAAGIRTKYNNGTYSNETTANDIYAEYQAAEIAALVSASAVDYTSVILNPSFETGDMLGWSAASRNDTGVKDQSNGTYSITSGEAVDGLKLFNSWGGTAENNVYQTIKNLPAGTYTLTAVLAGFKDESLVLAANETTNSVTVTDDKTVGYLTYVTFTLADAADVVIKASNTKNGENANSDKSFIKADNFRLYAGDVMTDDYTALNAALTVAGTYTLGFEKDEYAPYNNVSALTAVAKGEAVNQEKEIAQPVLDAIVSDITGATWTANDGAVDIIYNGNFAEANGTNPKGWTRSNGAWGQQITGLTADANDVNEGTTTGWYYNTEGAWEYGKDNVYKMPLAASSKYKLTFKYRSHSDGSNNNMKASVLNGSSEGLAEVTFAKNGNATKFVTATAYFTTGAAGNYILSLTQSGNTHLTDVNIERVASTTLALNEDVTYAPEDRTFYETVSLTRTIKADTWNTFCVPFDITNEELLDKFGAEVAVAEFSDDGESADAVTVNFNTMATPAITANKPVLLKGEAGTSFDFSGKLIKTGEAKVSGTYVDFVGTYAASTAVASGNYFISANQLWKSEGATTIKGTRAYIDAKNAVEVKMFFDDLETGISSIDNGQWTIGNAEIYNLAGQRMSKAQKGVNIINGKKVLVK